MIFLSKEREKQVYNHIPFQREEKDTFETVFLKRKKEYGSRYSVLHHSSSARLTSDTSLYREEGRTVYTLRRSDATKPIRIME